MGDRVHRPAGIEGATVQALLTHLRNTGFDGAPRPFGFDERGRHVIEFIEGAVAKHPIPRWATSTAVAFSVGELIRGFRNAAGSFEPEEGMSVSHHPPSAYQQGSWGHNDVTPGNVIFRNGKAYALIDFDWTAPSDEIWELANAAQHWGPVCDPEDSSGAFLGSDPGERIRELAAGFGATQDQKDRLMPAIRDSLEWAGEYVRMRAHEGHEGFGSIYGTKYLERQERARRWLRSNASRLRDVLG